MRGNCEISQHACTIDVEGKLKYKSNFSEIFYLPFLTYLRTYTKRVVYSIENELKSPLLSYTDLPQFFIVFRTLSLARKQAKQPPFLLFIVNASYHMNMMMLFYLTHINAFHFFNTTPITASSFSLCVSYYKNTKTRAQIAME